jgi:penicillin amidase
MRSWFVSVALVPALLGCKSGTSSNGPPPPPAVEVIPQTGTVKSSQLSAPVDVVRDEHGIPHIYGDTFADVAFAEGYVMAMDRLVEMDLGRHEAEGTLAEIGGDLSGSVIDGDIGMRVHHLTKTAQDALNQIQASTDPADQALVTSLTKFSAGINAFITDAQAGVRKIPYDVQSVFDITTIKPWTEVDSVALSFLQAFQLAFDADSEISVTAIDTAGAMIFDSATNPDLLARKGIAKDLEILDPLDPTHTITNGWTGMNGDTSTAMRMTPAERRKYLALLEGDIKTVRGQGDDHILYPSRGSNNWIIGPQLSATGHTLVANDTHLSLSNPPIFYLVHLVARGGPLPVDAMGVQFPGIPGIVLGNNQHVAWGATVNNIDVTDVYSEAVIPSCDSTGVPCVTFNGSKVPLVPRTEAINIGHFGHISNTINVTLYDVPQHGPIIPRINADHTVQALGATELSIKYTGYEPAQLLRGVFGVITAKTMKDAVASLDRDFKYGGQNWVVGDDQGNFGWTEVIRVPRRAAGHAPWKVLPGDGSAEWGPDMDPRYIPHAYNPARGFLATANADPIGVTDDGDPFFDEPVVDGSPLYLGWNYDPGSRVGRITKRIQAMTANGAKLSLDDLQSIQADATTEWGQAYAPTLIDAAQALAAEIATPGTNPDLSAIATAASAATKGLVSKAHDLVAAWTFDTPSGMEDNVTAAMTADSEATAVAAVWWVNFVHRTLDDELAKLGVGVDGDRMQKLVVRMCTAPTKLATGVSSKTNDPVLFDDLTTATVVESKRMIAARALVDALDYLGKKLGADPTMWRWGAIHTLTLAFLAPDAALQIPVPNDVTFPNGFPRHGDNGTVDVGGHGLSLTDFTYAAGPAIRFVCDLDPAGLHARNAIPGGETTDPRSPHYTDQLDLWRKNQTFNLAYTDPDVVTSAQKEYATNKDGRIVFTP